MWPECIFATDEGLHGQFPVAPQSTQLKGFGWISEFAQQKQRKQGVLPELNCMRLVEIRNTRRGVFANSYAPPEVIRKEFEDAGIKLEIMLTRPL